MNVFWERMFVVLTAGALGAVAMLVIVAIRRCPARARAGTPLCDPPASSAPGSTTPSRCSDSWANHLSRCEQAVRRAARAADSVSSMQARRSLHAVVRRMEAELPNVHALVELGRSFDSGTGQHEPVVPRVRGHLDDAVDHFDILTEHMLDIVTELVTDPDLERLEEQVTTLRGRFPISRPMSTITRPELSRAD